MQEEETNIVDQAVEPTAEATPDTEHQEAAGSEDKPTRTLKLNRSAASTAEEHRRPAARRQRRADGDTAQATEEGEHQGGGRNRRNRNRRNRREPMCHRKIR